MGQGFCRSSVWEEKEYDLFLEFDVSSTDRIGVAGQAVSLPSNQPPAVLYTEPPLVNHETTFTGSKMTLTAIHAHQSTYGHMFLYGSSLLHSPAFGYGWFLIASFGDDSIKDFASSPVSGKFAFIMTNNHSIFLGTTGSKYMSQFNALDYFDFLPELDALRTGEIVET